MAAPWGEVWGTAVPARGASNTAVELTRGSPSERALDQRSASEFQNSSVSGLIDRPARSFNQLAVEKVTISRRRVPYGIVADTTGPACADRRASPVAHDSRGGTMATSVLDDLKRVCHRLRSAVDPDARFTREAL